MCKICPIVFLSLLGFVNLITGQSNAIETPPFYFNCKQFDRLFNNYDPNEPLTKTVEVELAGNQRFYIGGHVYKVTVRLLEDFDSAMITGVYSTTSSGSTDKQTSYQQRKMCTILHSHVKRRPTDERRFDFRWMAPPEDMGCIDFVGTFTRKETIILKDEWIFHLCPASDKIDAESVTLSGVNQKGGVIFHDDFETGYFVPSLWRESKGFKVSHSCQPIFHGLSATVCNKPGEILDLNKETKVTTIALNLTSAGTLQFTIGQTSCTVGDLEDTANNIANITILYGQLASTSDIECSNWNPIQTIVSFPQNKELTSYVIPLHSHVRQPKTCLQWSVQIVENQYVCFGMDDVIVTNTADRPHALHADFDPFNAVDWLSLPGGKIHRCRGSKGKALVFNANNQRGPNLASTRDLQLISIASSISSDQILWRPDFDALLLDEHWEFQNARMEVGCENEKRILILQQSSNSSYFSVCSPSIDLSLAGNLRFRIEPFKTCEKEMNTTKTTKSVTRSPSKLNVWIERYDGNRKKFAILSGLVLDKDPVMLSISIPSDAQEKDARICWQLLGEMLSEKELSSWSVDDIQLLPTLPSHIQYTLQFRLNMACDMQEENNTSSVHLLQEENSVHVMIQYSNDQGSSWNSLHNLCLPPTCIGAQSKVIQTTWSSQEMVTRPWDRITLPISFASLAESVRFRFIQKGKNNKSSVNKHWAVDDIYLEECSMGCSGHGTCIEKGHCSCDDDYQGEWCQYPVHQLSSIFRENFEHEISISRTFSRLSGHKLSGRCGQVGAGLAAIFEQSGSRLLTTLDLDTTDSQIFRFALRMNGPGSQLHQHCPGPDRPVETIYIHSSCNGGITWSLLKFIEPYQTKEESTQLIRIQLTPEAKGPSCRFRIWQAQHSGSGKDVWAVDDLYIGPNLTQTLTRNSSSILDFQTTTDAFVGRHQPENFCKRHNVMVLQADELEETYPVRIEPFSVLQLELAVGCSLSTPLLNNNSVVVQFSVDGGKHWNDLDDSRRHVSLLQDWRRIGIKLPPASWSEATRFRIAQTGSRPSDRSALGIDYFYAGPDECSDLCRGNGRCSLSGCICDDGFSGESCLPDSPLVMLKASDETLMIGGRNYLTDHDGCLVRGTQNIMFDGLGMRSLETKEITYSPGTVVMFFLRLGFCESPQIGSHDVFIELQVSWDGINWILLREYRSPFFFQPQLEQIEIFPSNSLRSKVNPPPFKIRFVQTGIHSKDQSVWSVAGLTSSSQADVFTGSDIGKLEQPLSDNTDFWLVRNDPDPKSSCLFFDTNCVSRIAWYGALTKKVFLNVGDSIQFDIAVQHFDSTTFPDTAQQILLEYSADGADWQLVQPECLHTWSNCLGFHESSRLDYRSFISSEDTKENRFYFNTSKAMANKAILLRWLHHRIGDQKHHPLHGFQIQNLYIGSPCSSLCSGHGKCWNSMCHCENGYSGDDCSETEETKTAGFYDTFVYKENAYSSPRLRPHWGRVIGGKLMPNYCDGSTDGVVFFGSRGPRSLQTLEIDTRNLRMVQFTLAVTSVSIYKQNCRLAAKRKSLSAEIPAASLLVIDYSNDNGLTWTSLGSWPLNSEIDEKRLGFSIPDSARTARTKIRWWQLTYPNGNNRDGLQWYLDDVLLNLNITNPIVFEYENQSDEPSDEPVEERQSRNITHNVVNDGTITDWMGWQGLVFREPLDPVDTLLGPADLKDGFSLSYAETWDMEISDPTFAQFQLLLPEEYISRIVEVRFEYSTDMGRHWSLVELECYNLHQLSQQCEYLHPPSRYFLNAQNNASRITVHLPRRSITESTRFRWISENWQDRGPTVWGVGRVYIGGTCPWMCSGHGTCKNGLCSCDAGYGNLDCVPINPLPRSLSTHFDVDSNLVKISGGGISTGCGVLMSGPAAVFHKDGLRYFESIDLDLTAASYAQMTVKFNCWAEFDSSVSSLEPSHQRLLLQYSVNGGITWILIQEVKVHPQQDPQLVIINLMRIPDLTNCTRLRMWQPVHTGEGWDTWAIDGFVLHSTTPMGVILTSDFKNPRNHSSTWLTWFGGQIRSFCTRDGALLFRGELGEQQVFTGDAMITAESVLQFEINVGCGKIDHNIEHPIRLEFSNNGGQNWHLVVNDASNRNPYDRMPHQMSTVYSSKTTNAWKRETVMLSHLETSKAIRFRWSQGYLNETYGHLAPQWAIRNVILSPQCPELCNGHGRCTEEGSCECDDGYQGDACETVTYFTLNPQNFHESFITVEDPLESFYWIRRMGGEHRGQSLSNFGIGGVFVMDRVGVRMLETRDLDLSNANFVQFHFDSFDSMLSEEQTFVTLDYSINGGIEWTTLEIIPLDGVSTQQLYQVPLPSRALSLATRLKWSQLGDRNENLHTTWAIDEIYIGGEYYAKSFIEDDFTSIEKTRSNFLYISGGKMEPSCGSLNSTLHFPNPNGKRMVVTKDIKVIDQIHVQYATSSGCDHPNACNRVRLEYSDNYGLVWRNLPGECLPGEEVDCKAFEYHSELLSQTTGYLRTITVPIPVNKGIVRFRWISDDESVDWTLHWVYIGSACGHCNGRGRCWEGSCQCHRDWTGESCEISSTKLISSVRESFSNNWNSSIWFRINGGSVSSICGNVDSGPALHFHEACDRYAETLELDLRQVIVIQFHLRAVCGKLQNSPTHGVLLFQYSLNGGVKWKPGLTMSLGQFQESKLVSFYVPDEAQTNAVKLRWWQLGQVGQIAEDWSIDSFIIDHPLDVPSITLEKQTHIQSRQLNDYQADEPEKSVKSTHLRQLLNGLFGQHLWWRKINVEQHDYFCGKRGHILRGRSNTVEESILETSDFWVVSTKGQLLSFDMIVGDCGHGSDSIELMATTQVKFPVRFEVSYDHGISWKLFHPLKVRGEKGHGPQIPSIYPKLDKWHTYQYSLDFISGERFARFRWRHPKFPLFVSWAVNDFDISSVIRNSVVVGLETLSDDFNDGTTVKAHWRFFSGGKIVHPNERLGDGTAGLFQGSGIKLLQTVALDLTFGKNVEFILNFQLNKGKRDHEDITQNVILQCSPDNGFKWILIQDYHPQHYTSPTSVHAVIPEDCQNAHSILRWWQPVSTEAETIKKYPVWFIDNIAIEYSREPLTEIYDNFSTEPLNQTQWQFHPNGVVSNNLCGTYEVESSLNFISGENNRFAGITSRHVVVNADYAAYFKIRTSCGLMACHAKSNKSQIRFEIRHGYEQSFWSLAKPNCFPSSTNSLCDPQMYHSSSAYTFDSFPTWQRVIIPLKSIAFANKWQFRWITQGDGIGSGDKNTWAIKDVYIGRMCPSHCHGHGDCIRGGCHCDNGYSGLSCASSTTVFPASLPVMDHFENIINPSSLWKNIIGGNVKIGCGSFIPLAHGKHLHFDGCGTRMASTMPIDVSMVRRIAFVIRIGTPQQIPSCRIQPSNTYRSESINRVVLLQYSYNGVDWFLLASHGIRNFIEPQKMIYNVPVQKKAATVQFRWWQPQHGGSSWDQWALDNVEILI